MVAEGKGSGTATRITFAPVRAKYFKITQTAETPGGPPWMIQRLQLFEPASGRPAAAQ